jgi:hypothetical protein
MMKRFLALCLCLCLVSCGKSPYGDHPPYPASGQVLVNGEPAAEAVVALYHDGEWGPRTIMPQGWTDADGRFVLSTYGVNDGAPAGDYKVSIEWPAWKKKTLGPDKLGSKFADADTSGLTAHIEKGANELPPFNLKATLVEIKTSNKGQGGRRAGR